MEGGSDEKGFDEFEMILGEIPNVTSGNLLTGRPVHSSASQGGDVVSTEKEKKASSGLYASYLPVNMGKNLSLFDVVEQNESNLPDDKSLLLEFQEMRIKENPSTKTSSPSLAKKNWSSYSNNLLLNWKNPYHQIGYDTLNTRFLSSVVELESQSLVSREHELINLISDDSHNLKFLDPNIYEPKQLPECLLGNFAEHTQVSPTDMSIPLSLNLGFNSYELLPTIPIHRVDLANLYQPSYCGNGQSPLMNIPQPDMAWFGKEAEKYGRLCQQLQSHRPEFCQVQTDIDLGLEPLDGKEMHPFSEFSGDQHVENCKENLYWSPNTRQGKYNHLDYCQYQLQESSGRAKNSCSLHGRKLPSVGDGRNFSAKHFQGNQKIGQCIPERTLMNSNGISLVRGVRPNLLKTDEYMLFHGNSARFSIDHDHQRHLMNLRLLNGCYRSSPSDNFEYGIASSSIRMKHSSMDKISGRIYLMAKDQHDCRFLQKKILERNQQDIDKIFSEIISHIAELMTDPFGNYLIQKLLEVCNKEQMMCILKVITTKAGELIRISCDVHGTRAVQKVIETLKESKEADQIYVVFLALKPGIISIMKNVNGNHVAQRLLQCLPEYNEFLLDAAIAHSFELATDRQACCVLQKCIAHSVGDLKEKLISEISSYSLILSQDAYGNYVVQFLLDEKIPWAIAAVLKHLKGNFEHLSLQKYSSNVVEKCLKLAGDDDFAVIIHELLNSPQLLVIMLDQYGNYVMQSSLRESEARGILHTALAEAIRPHSSALRTSPYGKKVLSCAPLCAKK
ncbi:Pumilio like 12 [Apostasia shenzhenica]|uniref:Pumilio like 12 n=1 Tax=Apostasia shenzhenica TaxID=1088818 RepID=A0A2H9ZRB0_9ASPA|nr:Pumilio like 12 [Apostasia shenzhenica]